MSLQVHHSVNMNANPSRGELTVLFAGQAQTQPVHKIGPQLLDYYLLHLVIDGCGEFETFGNQYELKRGDSFFIFPGELSSYKSDAKQPWKYRWVGFRGDYAVQLLSAIGVSPLRPVITSSNWRKLSVLIAKIQQTLQSAGGISADLMAEGLLRQMLSIYSLEQPSGIAAKSVDRRIEQAIEWMNLQYMQPVTIESMALSLGYHRTYLSKMFKEHTGMSPIAFLNKIRMERAKAILLEPYTVEQVASSVGFTDPLYFSRQFKKYSGMSPSDYRNRPQGSISYDCAADPKK